MRNHPANILPCRKGQSGSALIMALLVLLVMSIVVMGMATDSDLDLKISRNLQQKNEAFNNAETGIAIALEIIRESVVKNYTNDNNNSNTSSLSLEAKDFDFVLSRELKEIYSNNSNITLLDSNENKDMVSVDIISYEYDDGRRWFELYAVGKKELSKQRVKVTITEDTSINPDHLKPESPLSLYNENPALTIKGSSFVSGHNHSVPSVFACTGAGCSPGSSDNNGEKLPLYSNYDIEEEDIVQQGNAEIEDFNYDEMGIGSSDVSDEMWIAIANSLISISSSHYEKDDTIPDLLGTRDTPEITVIDGEHNLNSLNGAGILVLTDGARITGNFHFEGLVIIVIDSDEEGQIFSGGNNTIYGSMLVLGGDGGIEIEGEDDGSVDFAGTPSVLHSEEGLDSALSAYAKESPLQKLSWTAQ